MYTSCSIYSLVSSSFSYRTSDTLMMLLSVTLLTFLSLSHRYVTKTHTYLPNLAQLGYGFNCTYHSTALSIFSLWFSLGNGRWTSSAHVCCRHGEHSNWIHSADWHCAHTPAVHRKPQMHRADPRALDSWDTCSVWHWWETRTFLERKCRIAGTMQAQPGTPSRAQLELDMQGTVVWFYTAHLNLVSSGLILASGRASCGKRTTGCLWS